MALATAVVGLVALRLATPFVLEQLIEREASRALGRAVEVGSVDLSLLRGRVGVNRVYAGPLPTERGADAPLAPENVRLGAARVAADVSLRDLLRGRIRVQDVRIDAPRVLRLRDVAGHLPPLLLASATTEAEEPRAGGGPPPLVLDRLRVTRARFFYFDASRPERVPFELGVEELRIEDLGLEGGALHVAHLDIGEPTLRVLDGFAAADLADDAAPPPPPPPDAEPLAVHVAELTLRDASASFLREAGSDLEARFALRATDVRLGGDAPFPVEATLDVAGGRISLDGRAALGPVRFDGTLGWSDLSLAPLAEAALPADSGLSLAEGSTRGALEVALRLGEGGALTLGGDARVDGLKASDAAGLELGWSSLAVALERAHVELGGDGAPEIALASLALRAPVVRYVRSGGEAAPPEPDAPAARAPRVRVAQLDVSEGRVTFEDASVSPAHRSVLRDLTIAGRALRWPERQAESLRIDVADDAEGRIQALATGSGAQTAIDLDLAGIGLSGFSPYVASTAGYRVDRGRADLDAKVVLAGERVRVDSDLVLHRLGVTSVKPAIFQKRFGMSLDTALALLRDPLGDIRIPLDFTIEGRSSRVDLGSLLIASLRQALVGALTTPLKGVTLLLPDGDDEGRAAPGMAPVAFRAGSVTLESPEEVDGLAALLKARPGLGVMLHGGTDASDRPGIAQQLLSEQIAADAELPPVAAGLLQRRRLVRAVEARGRGEEAELSPEDQAALDAWLGAVEIDEADERAFAQRRAEALQALVLREAGVEEARVVLGDTLSDLRGVAIELVPVVR